MVKTLKGIKELNWNYKKKKIKKRLLQHLLRRIGETQKNPIRSDCTNHSSIIKYI